MKTLIKSSNSKKVLQPPTYLLGALVLMIGIHFVIPQNDLIKAPWNLLGLILIGFGVVISTLAEKQFHKVETTVKFFDESSKLVTDGLFRLSRNPMYLGFVLVLVGVWISLGSLIPFFIIPCFMTIIQLRFIQVEEQMLAEKFGLEWQNYRQRVRRWI